MELWLIAQGASGPARHAAVESPPECSVGDLVRELATFLGVPTSHGAPLELYCERLGAWLDGKQALRDSGLLQGDRLVVAPRAESAPDSVERPSVDLVVVDGALVGMRVGLADGVHTVGRDGSDDVRLEEPSVSAAHLRLRVEGSSVVIFDNDSTNGTEVNGERLEAGVERAVEPGEIVRAGRVAFTFEPRHDGRASALSEDQGWLLFNRPPRRTEPFRPAQIAIPAPPPDPAPSRLPLATAILPIVAGLVLWAVTKNAATLIFVALSPIMVVGSTVESWRRGKRGFRRDAAAFRARLEAAKDELRAAHGDEVSARRAAAPAPVDLCGRALRLATTVWERRPDDDDYLSLRIGAADRASSVQVTLGDGGNETLRAEAADLLQTTRQVPDVPVVAPLRDGALGICGHPESVTMLARSLVVQAAVLHSPRDVALLVAVPEEDADNWSWLKWLPHARPPRRAERRLAKGPKEARALIESVVRLLEQRRERRASGGAGVGTPRPTVLLVLHEAVVADRAALDELLRDGPAHGISCVWLGRALDHVPGECRTLVELGDGPGTATFEDLLGGERIAAVTPDGLAMRAARSAAQALAPLRDPVAPTAGSGVPDRVTLFETLGVRDLSPTDLVTRWRGHEDGLRAPIGVSADGAFTIDLREDGPHGLIGGTSGSGKSELLQSIVAGLAYACPPDRLSFLLIDYKGGAAFRECASLPHTVGVVTDLDHHLSERALESLGAELRRRERFLHERGVSSLGELELRDGDPGLASLVIVVDEFATLVAEIPSFVDGIVNVAQRGRSLGLHLLLATQRPRGALNASILANTNLRIALRVTDASESVDVIDSPDASRIPRSLPGRALARTEHGVVTEFQSAFANAPALDTTSLRDAVRVLELGFGAVVRRAGDDSGASSGLTQLSHLVATARRATEQSAAPTTRPASPWLPPLPETVSLDEDRLRVENMPPGSAVVGLLDEPASQRQRPFVLDLVADGAALVYGTSGSGKTTLLRTFAGDIARRYTPDEVALYALDFGAHDLGSLLALPHCGAVVTADEPDRVVRLFRMIERVMAERRRAAGGGERLPDETRLVLLLDGYAAFTASFERAGAELLDAFQRVVAEGRPLGVHVVVTADRRGAVPPAVAGRIQRKVVLRMADADELAALGVRAPRAGQDLPPGRGFVDGIEIQVAHLGEDPSPASQAAGLRAIGESVRRESDAVATPVAALPETLRRADLPGASGLLAPIGLGETLMDPVSLDLGHGHFLIAGPRRSGRTTTLETAALSLLGQTSPPEIHVLAPRGSSLGEMAGVTSLARGQAECEHSAAQLVATLQQRGIDSPPMVIVVDDAEELAETAAATPLLTLVRGGRDAAVRVVAAVERNAAHRAFGNWIRELRNEGHGLLLRPEVEVDGELLGTRLPRGLRRTFPPGRGFLVEAGNAEIVQIAGDDS